MKLENIKPIISAVEAKEGITYSSLQKSVFEGKKNITYILIKMEAEQQIKSVKYGKYRHYFSPNYPKEDHWIRIFEQYPIPSQIIRILRQGGSNTVHQLSIFCDIKESVIKYHLKRMVDKNIVECKKKGKYQLFKNLLKLF